MNVEITKERRDAYVEVLAVLEHMETKYIEKIPNELLAFFESNKSAEHKFQLDSTLPLKEQQLMEKTLSILAMLNLYYWCEDENHKQELVKIFKESEEKVSDIQVGFAPELIFDNTSKIVEKTETENVELTEYKENILQKIINAIKRLFGRK